MGEEAKGLHFSERERKGATCVSEHHSPSRHKMWIAFCQRGYLQALTGSPACCGGSTSFSSAFTPLSVCIGKAVNCSQGSSQLGCLQRGRDSLQPRLQLRTRTIAAKEPPASQNGAKGPLGGGAGEVSFAVACGGMLLFTNRVLPVYR